jgi:4-hydroxybenzoate polyprenyltransferase
VAATAGTILASQLAVGWSNDAIDAARDAAVGRPDKPVAAGEISRRTVTVAAVVAAAATVPLALLSGLSAGLVAALGLGSALLYNKPLKGTVVSVLPYAVSFASLAAFVVLGSGAPPPWWLLAAAALLGSGAHFANALPDLDDDAATGVRGLPHRLGRTGSSVAAAVLLLAVTALLAFAPAGSPSWVGLAALVVAAAVLPVGLYVAAKRPGSRAAFRAVLLVALVDVGLLLAGGLAV